ncbi:MAG: CRTAC1 family protein, partial [Acidobacteriota bacterium]
QESGLAAGSHLTVGVMATDFDNSRDIDFYFRNYGAAGQLFSNLRDGSFKDLAAEVGAQAASAQGSALSLGDLDRDARMDWVVAAQSGASSRVLTWAGNRRYRESPLSSAADGAFASQLFDYDNDGDLDLLLLSASLLGEAGSGGLQLMEYADGRFSDATRKTGLDRFADLPLRGAAIGDLDGDGDLDIVVNVNGAAPLLLRNEGGNQNNWIVIDTRGTNSNKAGIGAKVEIRSGDFHLKREVTGGHGLLSQSSHLAHFGLGKRTRIDFLRLLWPGGVLQSELNPPVNQKFTIEELDRKGTSCPLLYVWDGRSYRFLTDFLGGSAFGYLLEPGVYNVPDTDEYLKLDRNVLRLKEGRLAVTLNNQLEEVIFFDKLQLVAVDHLADYEVFADEKLLPGPPYDDFRLFTVSNARPPVSARDGQGRDILPRLRHIDREYPDLFRKLPFKGYAEPHQMVLDLGPVSNQRTVLILHAWIDYADSTSNLAAWQAGVSLQPPRLQVKDGEGNWVTVIERMGFPAGLPKPMTVDLSGKFLSDSRQVRILTNMRIYWDQVVVESGPARRGYKLHRLPAAYADLHFHGFPEFSSPDGRQPKQYFYDRVSPIADWKVHRGAYTRYGDVLPLLSEADDRYVITRSGDEVEAYFDLSSLPSLEEGWVRDYLLYVDGFGKDMDVNSAYPDLVEPLPFHGMGASLDDRPPESEEDRRQLRLWNTRRVGQ